MPGQSHTLEASQCSRGEKALIALLEKSTKDRMVPGGAGRAIEKVLRSPAVLIPLKQGKTTTSDGTVYIGDWGCDLKTLRCSIVLDFTGHRYIVDGRFSRDKKGVWRAEITGYSHLNTGP
jgi:hypothetical protein